MRRSSIFIITLGILVLGNLAACEQKKGSRETDSQAA